MSVCDRITDRQLELLASAMRRLTILLDRAGITPDQVLTLDELGVWIDLNALCPEPPNAEEGAADATA